MSEQSPRTCTGMRLPCWRRCALTSILSWSAMSATLSCKHGASYLCSGETRTWLDVVGLLRQLYPSAPLPSTCADGSTTQPCLLLKNDKIKADLGLEFTPLLQTLQAQCRSLERAGLLRL